MTRKNICIVLSVLAGLAFVLLIYWRQASPGGVSYVMLTWRSEDTSTTMTVLYQTRKDPGIGKIYYDTLSHGGNISLYRFHQSGEGEYLEGVDRAVHVVELTQLLPGTDYYFVPADDKGALGKEFSFRTLPADDSPIRIVTGGDMGISEMARKVSGQAAKKNPDLVIIGGDLAYADGKLEKARKWDKWMENWSRTMVSSDGRIIPFIAAIGNHEVNLSGDDMAENRAPFFTRYLRQSESNPSFFARRLGANVGLIVLDSSHLHPPGDQQRLWLEAQLKRYRNLPYRIAVYHRPLYPGGVYPRISPGVDAELINAWLDLFDRYALTLALENHFHVHKRTKVLFGNAVAEDNRGTVYLGDGAWGMQPRQAAPDLWYIETASAKNHFWVIDSSKFEVEYRAIDAEGKVFDGGRRVNAAQALGAVR